MNRLLGVGRIHLRNRLSWLIMPWVALSISFAFSFLFSLFIDEEIALYTGGILAIYIYMFIMGTITPNDTFPFALGFSVRRTDYYLGTAGTVVLLSAVWAVVLLLLSLIENYLTNGWGVGLRFFHLPYLNDSPLIGQLWINFVILTHMYFLGFVISNIYQRFGRIGMYTFFILVSVLYSTGAFVLTYFGWWGRFFGPLAHYSAIDFAFWGALLTVCYALMSYILLRRATVR